MNRMTAIFVRAFFFACIISLSAQVAPTATLTNAFSPVKRELIKEFLDAVGGKQSAE
jgi:hypothetical protein